MHAYIFVGGTSEIREEEMRAAAKKYGSPYEFQLEKIADVRALADFTKYTQSSNRAIIIKDIDKATKEASNAFLKILEEPGRNISYFLSCANEQTLLPTIISRCQVTRVLKDNKLQGFEPSENLSEFLKLSFGQKIKKLEGYKKKEDAKEYLEKLILSAHKAMIENGNNNHQAKLIGLAQETIKNLNLNANVNLQMTRFAVNSGKCGFTGES